jgi:DNA-directed RNA polymerase specialized sigma24 family protein
VLNLQDQVRFEAVVLPNLDAAFNLARWLLRGGADAEDASQEAMLRAYVFHGGDVRAWLLQFVRNTLVTPPFRAQLPRPSPSPSTRINQHPSPPSTTPLGVLSSD